MTHNSKGRSSMFDAGREAAISSTKTNELVVELTPSDKSFSPTKEVQAAAIIEGGIIEKQKTTNADAPSREQITPQVTRSVTTGADNDNNLFSKDRR